MSFRWFTFSLGLYPTPPQFQILKMHAVIGAPEYVHSLYHLFMQTDKFVNFGKILKYM